MSVTFLARAKTHRRDIGHTRRIGPVGGKRPAAQAGPVAQRLSNAAHQGLHQGMILRHGPGRKDVPGPAFKAGIARGLIVGHAHGGVHLFRVDDVLNLSHCFALGLAQRQAAVDVKGAAIGYGIAAGSLALNLGNGDRALAQKIVMGQPGGQQFDAKDETCCIVDGVAAQVGGRCMGSRSAHLDLHLQATAVPYSYLQVAWFTQHHVIGANALLLHQRLHGQPFTGLLLHDRDHIQVSGQLHAGFHQRPDGVHHRRQTALHVTGSTPVQHAILYHAVVWGTRPAHRITHVHHIHVAVVDQLWASSPPDPPNDIAHAVVPDVCETDAPHLVGHSRGHCLLVGGQAGNPHQILQEPGHRFGAACRKVDIHP